MMGESAIKSLLEWRNDQENIPNFQSKLGCFLDEKGKHKMQTREKWRIKNFPGK